MRICVWLIWMGAGVLRCSCWGGAYLSGVFLLGREVGLGGLGCALHCAVVCVWVYVYVFLKFRFWYYVYLLCR